MVGSMRSVHGYFHLGIFHIQMHLHKALSMLFKLAKSLVIIWRWSCCRWSKYSDWETCSLATDFDWKRIAEPVMTLYTETTDGSYIESKESALVWHHQDADPDFGSCQAKELLDHLESVLANEPVVVKRGQHIVEVKPQVWYLCKLLLLLGLITTLLVLFIPISFNFPFTLQETRTHPP